MDLEGEDACDKAKANGLARTIPEFLNCNISKKVIPMLPNGKHADIRELPIFKKQVAFAKDNCDVNFEYQKKENQEYTYVARRSTKYQQKPP